MTIDEEMVLDDNTDDDKQGTNQDDNLTVEDIAKEIGWNPDYDGDDKKSAAQFIRDSKEINKTIHKHMKRFREDAELLRRNQDELKSHYQRMVDAEKKSAENKISELKTKIEKLEERKYQVVEEGDVKTVREIDNEIKDLEKQRVDLEKEKDTPTPSQQSEYDPEFVAWKDQNKWYDKDSDNYNASMAKSAEAEAARLTERYGKLPLGVILSHVDMKMKELFPEHFTPKPKTKQSLETGDMDVQRRGTKTKSKFTPTEDQRRLAKDFVTIGAFKSEAEYYKELEKQHEAGVL